MIKTMETPRSNWGDDWSVGVDVRVERRGQAILDTRSAGLLDAVRQTNSISAAARLLGISYAHAWLVIRQADEAAGQSLIETAIGGRRGGGARLSPYGEAALTVFEKLRRDVGATAAKTLPRHPRRRRAIQRGDPPGRRDQFAGSRGASAGRVCPAAAHRLRSCRLRHFERIGRPGPLGRGHRRLRFGESR